MNQDEKRNSNYGNFKDNKKAPIHRWFQYPAGYSYRFVEEKISECSLNYNSLVLDPFLGCGTTSLVCKQFGINSIGVEAHPFVVNVAKIKLFWNYDFEKLKKDFLDIIMNKIFDNKIISQAKEDFKEMPELVKKCFSEKNLIALLKIKNAISDIQNEKHRDFFNLALTSALRTSCKAGTGWPYIAPSKYHSKNSEKNGIEQFKKQATLMISDIKIAKFKSSDRNTKTIVIEGDAKEKHKEIPLNGVDVAITSPPYLNNYDYADRTRFETYFFGIAKSWSDISRDVRDKLMIAATTQVYRTKFDVNKPLIDKIKKASPKTYNFLTKKIKELSKIRLKKGGKKSYDGMVAGYFNDIYFVIKNVYDYLKPNGKFILVLGDSAPYGIHIPTEICIGEIGKDIGFSSYNIEEIRKRGGKWTKNPQRHSVPLRESVLTLTK